MKFHSAAFAAIVLTVSLHTASNVFAGESIQFPPEQTALNTAVPAQSFSTPWYVEFYIHDWNNSTPSNTYILRSAALGIVGYMVPGGDGKSQFLIIYSQSEVQASPFCFVQVGDPANLPAQGVYVRYQHVPASATDECEMWDVTGNRIGEGQAGYTSPQPNSPGAEVGGTADYGMAFFRICTQANVPLGSRMPTTAGACPAGTELSEWKFDGDLSDASGNGYNLQMSGGAPTYAPTPHQDALAVPKTAGTPFWTNWVSLRAGYPNQLDGTSSLSQADQSNTVSCSWQALSGPSSLTFDSQKSCTPNVTGLAFGTYSFQLTVTDSNGNQSTQVLQVGSVATDANGVVIQSNPAADLLFGPMIAYGRNPWGYQDARAMFATTQRNAAYDKIIGKPPTWAQALPGTVSYPFAPVSTTVVGNIGATSTVIVVADASKLDLTSLPRTPTIVLINGPGGEEVRICSAFGNTLNVCYDGRGWRYGTPYHTGAQPWKGGTKVMQQKVTGRGTSLMATFNPAGPGWSGPITYNAGTVTATARATTVRLAGDGLAWVPCPTVAPGTASAGVITNCLIPGSDAIRISGTHRGTPFAFFAYITALSGSNSITMNRPYPPDADSAKGLKYSIIRADQINMVLHYGRCGTGSYPGCIASDYPNDGATYFQTTGCESDTACYLYMWHDPDAVHPTTGSCLGFSGMECNVHAAYMNGSGYVGDNYGPNFYDEGLAHLAFYLRSGWQPALDAFRKIEGQDGTDNPGWLFWPELDQGDIGGFPRRFSITGAWAAYLIDNKQSNLSGLRNFASQAVANISNPLGCNDDLREGLAYPASWLALAALFDPDASALGWDTQLSNFYTKREAACQVTGSSNAAENNSWRSGFLWNNNQTPQLTAVHGSPVVISQFGAISPQLCPMVAQGTATVTNGSDMVTGTGFANSPGKIMFEGTIGGTVTLLTFDFVYDSPTRIHLSGAYPGNTAGGVAWQIDYDSMGSPDSGLVFGSSAADPMLKENWACTMNSSTSITLDRPWDGPTETVFGWRAALSGLGLAGNGTQPFMLGINTLALGYGAKQPDKLGADYSDLAYAASNWIKNYGYDPVSGGLYYGRLFGMCEPVFADSSQPQNFLSAWRNPECSSNGSSTNVPAKQIARALSGEAQNAARINFEHDPSPSNLAFWDTFYCKQWDRPGYTAPGYECDGIGASNLDDGSLSGGKWTGFFFGVGMSHQWPAVRLMANPAPQN